MRLADSLAAELAQRAWFGLDVPGEISIAGIRQALSTLPGEVSLEDVGEWMRPAFHAISEAASLEQLEGRLVGALSAALILGAKLQETNGS